MTLLPAFAVLAVAAAPFWPQSVDEAAVVRARSSVPAVCDGAAELAWRIGSSGVARWTSDGFVAGAVLFADTFDSGVDWSVWNDVNASRVEVLDDPRGGRCMALSPPPEGKYTTLRLRDDKWVLFDASRPLALLWEALAGADGDPVYLRVDFRDASGKDLRPSIQIQSTVDPTQPALFRRNAILLNPRIPPGAVSLRIYFFVPAGRKRGLVDSVRLVDFGEQVSVAISHERAVEAEREAAADDAVLAYADCDITSSYPVMPSGAAVPGSAGAPLVLRECPGERIRAGVVLWSKSAWSGVKVDFTDLVAGEPVGSRRIPSSAISAKIVKCHYQAPGAPRDFVARHGEQVLVPELLLNDDTLVVADHVLKRNLLKCSDGSRTWYVDVNTIGQMHWKEVLPLAAMPVRDAPGLLPFDLPARENRQVFLRIVVPREAPSGVYKGAAAFSSGGRRLATVPIRLEVLPFALPPAETAYDRSREYTMGLYVWGGMSKDGSASLTRGHGSRAQVLDQYRRLVDYGITHPAFVWPREVVGDDARFRAHLALAREAGFPGRALHLGASGFLGSSADPQELAELKARILRAKAVAREFGFDEVYFYGLDEARGDRLTSQVPAWKAAHEAGAKIIVSGYAGHFALVGDVLDLLVFADAPWLAEPDKWHANGARLWKYCSPQTGPEDPMVYRRGYGLDLWRQGFDGGCTYCDIGGGTCWNDLAGLQADARSKSPRGFAYRTHTVFYPTADGVVETLALSGLEAAVKDVRVMTKFLQAARATHDREARAWFASLSFAADDLGEIRARAIDWILRQARQGRHVP